jgi:hypothetical protein
MQDVLSLGVKRPGRAAEHTSSAKVKNVGAIPPLPHTFSWRDTSRIKHRDNLTLPFLRRIQFEIFMRMGVDGTRNVTLRNLCPFPWRREEK